MAGSIFCDLEKAFDSVNLDILLSKLSYYGISGKAKLLLESCFQNRYQRFHITNWYLNSNTVSKWTKTKYGVSQGSILDPLLFLVRGLLEKYPTFGREKETGLLGALDT